MNPHPSSTPLPRVRLDLALLAGHSVRGPRQWPVSVTEMRLALDLRGWTEDRGWWAAPSPSELTRAAHAVTERESPGRLR